MVMTVSSILRREASLEEEGGGLTTVVGLTYSSVVGSPNVGGLDAPVEDLTLGCLELTFIWAALCRRKVVPIGAIICAGSDAGKTSKPKSNMNKNRKEKSMWFRTTPMNLN